MTTSRRAFLAQVACAFATAGLPCRIPAAVAAPAENELNEASLEHVWVTVRLNLEYHQLRGLIDGRSMAKCGVFTDGRPLFSTAHP